MRKVSVVIPVYNGEEYLALCLNSVFRQTYKNLEVIVVNDGSTDNTDQICKEYLLHKNFIYTYQANQGVSSARNNGLQRVSGEYILFVDSDDECLPEMVEYLVRILEDNDADISVCDIEKVDAQGNIVRHDRENDIEVISREECLRRLFLENPSVRDGCWNKLFKTDVIKHDFVEKRRANEDKFFCFEAICNAKTIVIGNEPMYRYYVREGSASHSSFSEKYFDMPYFAEEMYTTVCVQYPELEPYSRFGLIQCYYKVIDRMIKANRVQDFRKQLNNYRSCIIHKDKRDIRGLFTVKRWIGLLLLKYCLPLFCVVTKK